jgi:hypothetical protein
MFFGPPGVGAVRTVASSRPFWCRTRSMTLPWLSRIEPELGIHMRNGDFLALRLQHQFFRDESALRVFPQRQRRGILRCHRRARTRAGLSHSESSGRVASIATLEQTNFAKFIQRVCDCGSTCAAIRRCESRAKRCWKPRVTGRPSQANPLCGRETASSS